MKGLKLTELVSKLTVNESHLEDVVSDIILNDAQIKREKQKELEYGVTPSRNAIGIYRSARYRLFKLQLNPLAKGRVDLILTGAVKRGLTPNRVSKKKYKIVSTDKKWKRLMGKYGNASEGLNDKTFNKLQLKYSKEFNNRIKKELFG